MNRDLSLLRRFEPIIHYTRGEPFYPMDVAQYIKEASLWIKHPRNSEAKCLAHKGQLTLENLSDFPNDGFDSNYFLKFTDPLTASEYATHTLWESLKGQTPRQLFRTGGGRLARVGYFSRFIDAAFAFSLLARGRVPGDAAMAAILNYRKLLVKQEEYYYCGRVLRDQSGWLVLQYWFFYAFNPWRSIFYGVNDHEADWEMISIYLSESAAGEVTPEWVAYASHDASGDDLRRRWDDPELETVEDHPVIYAGAGSHASYYTAGEYLVEIELSFLAPLNRLTSQLQKFWHEKLGQYYEQSSNGNSNTSSFQIPFVDYARGDGLSIGPGQEKKWEKPYLINETTPWVSQYRGLWGMLIQDPLAGENAPAGPMYNRDGTVRRAWYDPVGWSGLDKLPPPHKAIERVRQQQAELETRQGELTESITQKSRHLTSLGVAGEALQDHPHLKKIYQRQEAHIQTLSEDINQLRAEYAENKAFLEALNAHMQALRQGKRGPVRAHIRRTYHPIPAEDLQMGRLMEIWAAVSTGLMLISLVSLMFFAPDNWFTGLILLITFFIVIESTFRRRLSELVTRITIGLAIVATVLLFFDFFTQIAIIGILVAGAYMMWQNLKELWD